MPKDPFRPAEHNTPCPKCGEDFGWNTEDGLAGQSCVCGYVFPVRKRKTKPKKSYHIDLPNPHDPEGPMIKYGVYASKKEALQVARHHFGTDAQGRLQLISEVDLG